MSEIAGRKSRLTWAVHISTAVLVVLWLFPTFGLLVSSFRTADQIASTGWWKSMFASEQNIVVRVADPDDFRTPVGDLFVVTGNLFGDQTGAEISVWGTSSRAIDRYIAGETADMGDGETLLLQANGDYVWSGNDAQISGRAQRVFATATTPPDFTLENYEQVLLSGNATDNISKAFFNTLTVTIPATIIPVVVAAFAAYALAWMQFPGRALLVAIIVGLLVVPLQLALIPLLKLHLGIGIGKGYLGVWLAHTGFGLPLAIYLLRNYIVGLPKELLESARIDGANHLQIFVKLIVPLSVPALASFSIFQFLWVWNDLLVALYIGPADGDDLVFPIRLQKQLGTFQDQLHLLNASAVISMIVPVIVFLSMQRYFIRGLLAGSVKGG